MEGHVPLLAEAGGGEVCRHALVALCLLSDASGWPSIWLEGRASGQPVCKRLPGLASQEQSVLLADGEQTLWLRPGCFE